MNMPIEPQRYFPTKVSITIDQQFILILRYNATLTSTIDALNLTFFPIL